MNYTRVPNLTSNLNRQALAILAMLEETGIDIPQDGYCSIWTNAWYNGRERGVSITVSTNLLEGALVITFGENRNSDSIFVDNWHQDSIGLNPPTVTNFTEEAYEQRTYFGYGHILEAAEFINGTIQDYVNAQESKAT